MATSDELPIVDLTALTALYRAAGSATTTLSTTASTTLTTTATTATTAPTSTTTSSSPSPTTTPTARLSLTTIPMATTTFTTTTTIQYIADDRHLATSTSGVINRFYVSDEESQSSHGSRRSSILAGAVDGRRSSILAGMADSRRSSIFGAFRSADCSRRSSAASPPPAYQALFLDDVFPIDTSIPLQPCLPDAPTSWSRRRSRGGLQGELLTLKSQPSIDFMAADPAIVSRYPSLQHFSSTNELDVLPVATTTTTPPQMTHCCDCTKSELACWVFTIACISLLAIGLVLYLISTDWSQVG